MAENTLTGDLARFAPLPEGNYAPADKTAEQRTQARHWAALALERGYVELRDSDTGENFIVHPDSQRFMPGGVYHDGIDVHNGSDFFAPFAPRDFATEAQYLDAFESRFRRLWTAWADDLAPERPEEQAAPFVPGARGSLRVDYVVDNGVPVVSPVAPDALWWVEVRGFTPQLVSPVADYNPVTRTAQLTGPTRYWFTAGEAESVADAIRADGNGAVSALALPFVPGASA